MDHHDLVAGYKSLLADRGKEPTKREYLANYPHNEAMLARIGGWDMLLTLVGLPKEMHKPRILLFDIEATNLSADIGFVLCIGYKWLGEKDVKLISIRSFKRFKRDVTCDKLVVEAFAKIMGEADMLVTWFGSLFDVPYLEARNYINDSAPLPEVAHFDGWRTARYRMKFSSNRLANLQEITPTKGKKWEKTHLDKLEWKRAAAGYVDSIKYVEEHCIADINVLEQIYEKLKPFSRNHPNLPTLSGGRKLYNEREHCPVCSSKKTNSRGWYPTLRGRKHRWSCEDCGKWWLGAAEKKPK